MNSKLLRFDTAADTRPLRIPQRVENDGPSSFKWVKLDDEAVVHLSQDVELLPPRVRAMLLALSYMMECA